MTGEIDRIMAEAAEKIRREGYAAGWRDCAALIAKTVAEAAPGDLPEDAGDDREGLERRSPPNNAPTVGTTPHYVYTVVRKKPGMTGAEVVAAVHADGHTVSDAQIRTSLGRLGERKLIVNRHKKWFPM